MADPLKKRLDETTESDWNGEKDKILELYARRKSVAYISRSIGRSENYVSKILHAEFAEKNRNWSQMVLAQAQTLQWMVQKITDKIHDADGMFDRRDAELLLKYMEREARLFGLDKPTEHNVKIEVEQLSEEELVEQLRLNGIHVVLPALPPASPASLSHIEDAAYEVKSEPPSDSAGE